MNKAAFKDFVIEIVHRIDDDPGSKCYRTDGWSREPSDGWPDGDASCEITNRNRARSKVRRLVHTVKIPHSSWKQLGDNMYDGNLIFDIGMHEGEDTDFYLAKGFRVIGVEANPQLADHSTQRFQKACQSGRLTIINKAISEASGTIDFYVNDQVSVWGTADRDWMHRNEKLGATSHVIQVPSVRMDDLLDAYGVPYYLKVDIEGFDYLCVSPLISRTDKPKYLSVEAHAWAYDETLKLLNLLIAAGFNKFNIVPQRGISKQMCPNPPREGKYVDYSVPEGASGLFGKELPGRWLSAVESKSQFRRIYRSIRMNGPHNGVFRNIKNRCAVAVLNRLLPNSRNWFDIHATL